MNLFQAINNSLDIALTSDPTAGLYISMLFYLILYK